PWQILGYDVDAIHLVSRVLAGDFKPESEKEVVYAWRNIILFSITAYSLFPRVVIVLVLRAFGNWGTSRTRFLDQNRIEFKIRKSVNNNKEYFLLDPEEQRLYFSLLAYITYADIHAETSTEVKHQK